MADPITLDHLVRKLEDLNDLMRRGQLRHGEYDQRLARLISELRERRLDAERTDIAATFDDLVGRGVITPSVRSHMESRLGLT
jgi:hypothetical protein